MGGADTIQQDRPWTIYVLTAALGVSAISGLAFNEGSIGIRLVGSALGLFLAASIWRGQRWAFTLWFMMLSLCVGIILLVLFVQTVLFAAPFDTRPLPALATGAVVMALLLHPDTKRFRKAEKRPAAH